MNNHAGDGFDGFPVELVKRFEGAAYARPRTVAIVGSHPTGLEGVPWDDPDVEIWLFNEAPLKTAKYPRWDALLQIHLEQVYASENNWVNAGHWNWLQQPHGKTIWMQDVDPRVPDSVKYPLDEVLAMIPFHYLRSSPAMALALAIYLGYQNIMLFGSELSSNTEYAYQATNYAFWIGFALGRGINLDLRCWLSEFNQRIYGYEGELQLDQEHFITRAREYRRVWDNNERNLRRIKDRLDVAMLENKYDLVASLSIELENAAQITGEASGLMGEAERYSKRTDMISRQEFEKVAAQAQQDGDQLRSDKDHAGGKTEYVWNVWKAHGRNEALNQLRVFIREKTDLAYQVGLKHGIYQENISYMLEYDSRLQAAGGVRALGRQEVK